MSDWFDVEMELLDAALDCGEISQEQHRRQVIELRRDAKAEDDRQAIIDAGRGHLIK